MVLTTVEILALILVVASVIKIAVILIDPKSWYKVVKAIWAKPIYTGLVSFIAAIMILNFLLQTMTIIDIFAVMLFTSFIFAIGMSFYSKELVKLAGKVLNKNLLARGWFYLLIWIALLVWAILVLFNLI